MSQATKRLAAMKNNPRGDWQIGDVETVCRAMGVACEAPRGGGSHYTVSHPSQAEILTIPAHKPIKAVYIVKLVSFIQLVVESES
jgi:hypothetical protein